MNSQPEFEGHAPLNEYPWKGEVDRILESSYAKIPANRAFLFDCVMSLAYMDATAGLEKAVQFCNNCNETFNAHIGFINLCASCYRKKIWKYQKAAKPQSGALGKLTSEVILRFIQHVSPSFTEIIAMGGSGYADALIKHESGLLILAEVKSAPLLTYSLLLAIQTIELPKHHNSVTLTRAQINDCHTGLNMHGGLAIPLGKLGSRNWPFKEFADFVVNPKNTELLNTCNLEWQCARTAYISKDKNNPFYYLTNACGSPPLEAKRKHGWPGDEVISDGKTSAGMDRTDDIKKGIYQTLKIGITHKNHKNVKSALISNLPAYRHQDEYINPVAPLLWGLEKDLKKVDKKEYINREDLRYVFDYIITLDSPFLRDLKI